MGIAQKHSINTFAKRRKRGAVVRILLAICLALAAAWAGYWFIGSGAVKSGMAAWFDARRAEGWTAEYSDLSVKGFPSRFDTTLTAPHLLDPLSGLGWQAPFFQLLTLSYTPNHVIAVWPNTQTITSPKGVYTLASTDMRASLVIAPSTALAPERATLTATGVSLAPEDAAPGDTLSMNALRLAGEHVDGAEARYHLGLAAEGVAPPATFLTQVEGAGDRPGAMPRVIESVIADLTVDLTAPWDRHALEDARPQPTRVDIKQIGATWGAMSLRASGTLDIDGTGQPEGRVTIEARGWREMLALARGAGALTPDMAQTAERALGMMADGKGAIEVPLRIGEGRVWLGPIPIASAPLMRLQ